MGLRWMKAGLCGLLLAFALPGLAAAEPRDELVGDWVAMDADGGMLLAMTMAEDGTLSMGFDGEEPVPMGTWDVVDGMLQLVDDARPEDTLSCNYTLEEPNLTIFGEGDCNQAPPFTRAQ